MGDVNDVSSNNSLEKHCNYRVQLHHKMFSESINTRYCAG